MLVVLALVGAALGLGPALAYQVNSAGWTGTTGTGGSGTTTLPSGLTLTVATAGLTTVSSLTADATGRGATSAMFTPSIPATTPTVLASVSANGCVRGTTCADRGSLTISFNRPVRNPVLHIAGIGGYASGALHARLTVGSSTPAGATLGAVSAGATNLVTTATTIDTVNYDNSASCSVLNPTNTTAFAGCGSVPVVGTVSSIRLDAVILAPGTGTISSGADAFTITASVPEDYGDAPVSYDAGAAPTHVTSDLTLGATVDAENQTVQNTGSAPSPNSVAAGTSANSPAGDGADEDSRSSPLPSVLTSRIGLTYSLTIPISGASQAGQVCGWIDFNRNGVFDNPSERACSAFAAGGTSVNPTWTIPTATTAGVTYLRLRASYNTTQAQSPTGFADSGEVEDYTLDIKPVVRVLKSAPVAGDTGLFNLQVAGTTFAANVGNGGDTGARTVFHTSANGAPDVTTATNIQSAAVSTTVGETAGTATSLANYTSTYSCVDGTGATVASGTGTSTAVTLPQSVTGASANGRAQSITCTLTNTARNATVTLVKSLVPTTDAGRFNLLVGPTTVATAVGNAGTGSASAAPFAAVTVSETGSGGTVLANYLSTLTCVDTGNGNAPVAVASNTGTSGSITPTAGQQVRCTFTNTLSAPALTVTKTTSTPTYAAVGDVLTYSIVVRNSGNVPLTSVSVNDPNAVLGACAPTVLPGALAAGASTTCTATHPVTQADLDAGSYVNSATASGSFGATTVTSPPSTATSTGTRNPLLTTTKTSSTASFSAVGQTISYSIAVANTGNQTLTGVTVSDPNAVLGLCSPVSLPGTLAPGQSTTCPATHTVTPLATAFATAPWSAARLSFAHEQLTTIAPLATA